MTVFFNPVTKRPAETFTPRIKLPAIKREKGTNHHIARVNVLMCTLSIQYRVCDWLDLSERKKDNFDPPGEILLKKRFFYNTPSE